MHLVSSFARVPKNTSHEINNLIAERMAGSVAYYAKAGKEAISERLTELDSEWDIERVIGTGAPVAFLFWLGVGATRNRRFLAIPAAIAGWMIWHELQGWMPPLPLLRRFGFRTAEEIDEERYALRILRGDFRGVARDPDRILQAVRHERASTEVT